MFFVLFFSTIASSPGYAEYHTRNRNRLKTVPISTFHLSVRFISFTRYGKRFRHRRGGNSGVPSWCTKHVWGPQTPVPDDAASPATMTSFWRIQKSPRQAGYTIIRDDAKTTLVSNQYLSCVSVTNCGPTPCTLAAVCSVSSKMIDVVTYPLQCGRGSQSSATIANGSIHPQYDSLSLPHPLASRLPSMVAVAGDTLDTTLYCNLERNITPGDDCLKLRTTVL